jgi:hypothetical protein
MPAVLDSPPHWKALSVLRTSTSLSFDRVHEEVPDPLSITSIDGSTTRHRLIVSFASSGSDHLRSDFTATATCRTSSRRRRSAQAMLLLPAEARNSLLTPLKTTATRLGDTQMSFVLSPPLASRHERYERERARSSVDPETQSIAVGS